MKAVILARPGAQHQCEWGAAFAAGLAKHGWDVEIAERAKPCDLLVCWGIRRQTEILNHKRAGGEVCILERGYLGDRFKWTSVSFGGGLNGRAEFRGVHNELDRFAWHFGHLMQPWRERDGYALLIGQVPTDSAVRHVDINRWYRDTTRDLIARDYDVRYRPHPQAVRRGMGGMVEGAPLIGGTLEEALSGAAVVVTFSSNTAVESVLAGVPTVAADQGSMAWPVASHDVGVPLVMPDRTVWANELAWKQFTMDEMQSGECWAVVGGE